MIKTIIRNIIPIGISIIALIILSFQVEIINTLVIIALVESTALSLSGLAVYGFTKLDFVKDEHERFVLGWLFLGVHILVGLVVFSVYLAQFSN